MRRNKKNGSQSSGAERGATLVEFALTGSVFLLTLFSALDFGRLLWTHNALADAARQGARRAVSTSVADATAIRNTVMYGDANGGARPIVPGLTAGHIEIIYNGIGLGRGTVTVRITGYRFKFASLFLGVEIPMPDYQTTLTGETMGFAPPRI